MTHDTDFTSLEAIINRKQKVAWKGKQISVYFGCSNLGRRVWVYKFNKPPEMSAADALNFCLSLHNAKPSDEAEWWEKQYQLSDKLGIYNYIVTQPYLE